MKLTREEFRAVEHWLYDIKRKRVRLPRLRESVEKAIRDFKEVGISISAVNYDRVVVSGGERVSQPEKWVMKLERFEELMSRKVEAEMDLELFDDVMSELENEDKIYQKIYDVKYGRDYASKPIIKEMAQKVGVGEKWFRIKRYELVCRFAKHVL